MIKKEPKDFWDRLFTFLQFLLGAWRCPLCGSKEYFKTYKGLRCANDLCDYEENWRG